MTSSRKGRGKPLARRTPLTAPTITPPPRISPVQRVLANRQRRLGTQQSTTPQSSTTTTTITSPPPPSTPPTLVTTQPTTSTIGQLPPPITTTTISPIPVTSPPVLVTTQQLARPNASFDDKLDSLDGFLRQPPGMAPWELGEIQDVVQRGRAAQQSGVMSAELAADLDAALALAELIQIVGASAVGTQPILHRGLILDGVPVDQLTGAEVRELGKLAPGQGTKAGEVIRYLATNGPHVMTRQELGDAILSIGGTFDRLLRGEDVTDQTEHAHIARTMYADMLAPGQLAATLGTSSAMLVPGPQARALNEYLARNPNYVRNLKRDYRISFKFASSSARGLGGKFEDGTVHLEPLDSYSPETFLRLWLHETGHAGYQQALLQRQKLPEFWHKGEIMTLLARRRQLTQTLQQAFGPPGPAPQQRPRTADARLQPPPQPLPEVVELGRLQRQLDSPEGQAVWAKMSPDAQSFYRAWLVLRRNAGEHMLGVDLTIMDAAGRRTYQADSFAEFCAETFMLSATGQITAHLRAILDNPNISQEVKDAWIHAADIIDRTGKPILTG